MWNDQYKTFLEFQLTQNTPEYKNFLEEQLRQFYVQDEVEVSSDTDENEAEEQDLNNKRKISLPSTQLNLSQQNETAISIQSNTLCIEQTPPLPSNVSY